MNRPGGGIPMYMLNTMNQQNQANQNNNSLQQVLGERIEEEKYLKIKEC